MGGGIFTPAQKTRSKTNQSQSFLDTNNVDILQPDFINENAKECVEHALIDYAQIRLMIKQKYEFYLSCVRLPKMDYISKTDPAIYCYLIKDNEPEFIHKTEVIADDQDPQFAKPLVLSVDLTQYNKEVIFNIYDIDKYNHFGDHERQYIGTVQTSIQSILMDEHFQSSIRYDEKQSGDSKRDIQSQKRTSKSTSSQQRGEFKVRTYNCDQYSDYYIFQLEGLNIKSKESIYLRVVTHNRNYGANNETEKNDTKFQEEPKELPIYQTDMTKISKTINWGKFEIQEKKISKYLKFELYQFYESRVKKDLIGEFKVLRENIKTLHGTEQPICMLNKKKVQGVLKFQRVTKMMHPYSLLQYVYGGLNVQFFMAFDYSQISSNIYASEQENLVSHQNLINQYEQAIRNCIDLVKYYSKNQMVPMYGMGARLPPSYTHHSNCFALSGDWYDPEIDLRYKEEAVNIFRRTIKKIKPSSTLIFSDILKFINDYCEGEQFTFEQQTLCVLLIFSHNELLQSDIEETLTQLKKFVEIPFQVVNIGIGTQDFEYVNTFLSLENYESSKKFSFVPYENFKNDHFGFCQEIFKNIPMCLLEKARKQRIPPITSFDNLLVAREYYQKNLFSEDKKNFQCINERPFFDYLTQELGYKTDIIKDIFLNGLEEEDLGLVLDRIGFYSKPINSQQTSKFYSTIKQYDESVPQNLLKKVLQFHRLKEKYNAHTKKQENKTLEIKKQSHDSLSPFSFFYKPDQKNAEKQENQNNQQNYKFRLLPDYPESYKYTKINSANNLNQEYESNQNHDQDSVYNGQKNEDIENTFNSSPSKLQNSQLQQENSQKKQIRQNNFLNKWRDAIVQSANQNTTSIKNYKKQKPIIQGINCSFCTGEQINIILMPCGHNCCCQEYLDQFSEKVCPVCHINIIQIVKFYDQQQKMDSQQEQFRKSNKSKERQNKSPDKIDSNKDETEIQFLVNKQEFTNIVHKKKRKEPLDSRINNIKV
ncbi:hypothetical protein ABPG72_013110 [Tetrahymena utriculariae]